MSRGKNIDTIVQVITSMSRDFPPFRTPFLQTMLLHARDEYFLAASLSAIQNLTRQHEGNRLQFVTAGGLRVVARAISSRSPSTVGAACGAMRSISLSNDPVVTSTLADEGMDSELLGVIRNLGYGHDPILEHACASLCNMVERGCFDSHRVQRGAASMRNQTSRHILIQKTLHFMELYLVKHG